ncbi:hypothetical protein GWI33_020102 [Rhynchophorus ferrugineus]|uniref:Uncharacterized protein n=1 Tax=Rhynchophorus ferrugineus TaxID=354439 RepID=A0A834HT31_RHYFE|nr:hypothetical protein GWI33_020102 [Rhynchophorus ferrugineus]
MYPPKEYLDLEIGVQENGYDVDTDMLGNMYNSCEYKNFELEQKPITEDQLDQFCFDKYHDYIGNSDVPTKTIFNGGVSKKYSNNKSVKQTNTISNHRKKGDKSDDYESDIPLSPESEKKKELCSYLQLMKPTDKKTVMILQNRRSVRVKNLSLMQERRELEKKLKEENLSSLNGHICYDSSNEGTEIKSFNNGKCNGIDNKTKWLKYNGSKQSIISSCYFPKPASYFCDNIFHFDDAFTDWFKNISKKIQEAPSTVNNTSDLHVKTFIMPKVPLELKYRINDFDKFMEESTFLLNSKQFNNCKEIDDIKNIQFKLKTCTKKLKLKVQNVTSRRITRNRPQLISDIIHSLRNRNVRKLSLKKYQKHKIKYKNIKKKKMDHIQAKKQNECNYSRTDQKIITQTEHLCQDSSDIHNFIPDFNSLSNEHQQSLLINAQTSKNQCSLPFFDLCCNSSLEDKKIKKHLVIETPRIIVDSFIMPKADEKQHNGTIEKEVVEKNTETISELHPDNRILESAVIKSNIFNNEDISQERPKVNVFKKDASAKTLHRCLYSARRKSCMNNLEHQDSPSGWTSENFSIKPKKNKHSISISKNNGSVLKAFYLDYNLILCQELLVSFWTQTALGNVLGAQNMWIHKGNVQRLAINNNCVFKESLEMVISIEHNVAYVELWTKEHQSDIREGPVADIFATIYFWKSGQNGLEKKVLQLENINGFADDVQYSVIKSTPRIIVSWHLASNEIENKKTYIHCYHLANDYQTVFSINEFECVEHYVSSLHSIEDCDNVIAGCGENKITLWNMDYGYVVATVEMSEIKSPLSTLWVKCDRGFLFTLQQCVDRELRLIAIHGMNHSWKKLASYVPPEEYDRLKGVCVENGIIIAFYDQGIICWNAHTAETIIDESSTEVGYVSGKYVINVTNDQVNIRHAFTHLLYSDEL